jgi:O-antigen/teichoic acid export membrane protein
MTIVKSAVSGLSWTASSTIVKGVMQLAQLIILARILTPIELGVLAIINLVVGLAQVFGDAGISNALIYHKELNKGQLNQLYVVNVSLGIVVSISVALLAYPLAQFFSMELLTSLLILLAPVFFIKSLSQQVMALLQQKLQFNRIAKVEVFSSVAGFIILLLLINFDFRLEAVIFSQLATASILTLLILVFNRNLLPSFEKIQWRSIAKPVKYGLYQTGESFINFLSAQFDQLLIGKLLGAETLGIYAYVKALVFRPALQLINPIVNRVSFPLMVQYKDVHSESVIYTQIIRLLSFINIPLYLLMACYPELILSLAYGDDWLPHAELLKWLALYMLLLSLMNPIGVLLRATGEVKRGFWWNIGVTIIRPLLIMLSISSGVVWLVKVLVIAQVGLFFLHWYFLIRPVIKLSFSALIKAIAPPCFAFFIAALVVYLCNEYIWQISPLVSVIIVSLAYCLLIAPAVINVIKFIRK